CRSIHLDFPFLHFRLTHENSILALRCRSANAACGMWEVPFLVNPPELRKKPRSPVISNDIHHSPIRA
ncbi:hypothetical protein, partial [Sulfuritalea sp.]|uniref:hypothetical protein n=1 Tax=Sulfuritalea sp. TaxID=2480090 RepID=UPI001AC4A8B5